MLIIVLVIAKMLKHHFDFICRSKSFRSHIAGMYINDFKNGVVQQSGYQHKEGKAVQLVAHLPFLFPQSKLYSIHKVLVHFISQIRRVLVIMANLGISDRHLQHQMGIQIARQTLNMTVSDAVKCLWALARLQDQPQDFCISRLV